MRKSFETLNHQRAGLLASAGLLLGAMCLTLVLIIWAEDGGRLDFQRRWPTIVGLCGLVAIFVLYVQKKHRDLALLEDRMRTMAVREAAVQARFTELSFLFDISTQLQLRLDLQSMLDLAVQRLLPCLEAHQASIMLHDQTSGLLQVRATAGIDTTLVKDATVRPGEGIAGTVFSSGETQVLDDRTMAARYPEEIKRGRRIASGLCVPMRFRGTPIGVVSVSRTTGDGFSDLHARMLETFAEHCAATILKTNHHQELLRQVRPAA